MLKHLKTRNELPLYLRELGLNGIGVELGVADGWYSNQILLNSDLSILFSIDPWSQTDAKECNLAPLSQYEEARKTLNEHWHRSCILRRYSYDAVSLFQDNIFDFIYIDATHTKDACLIDMKDWWPKLKSGGIFSGHDYCDFHSGVKEAVDEFFYDYNLTLYTTELDFIYSGCSIRSWYTRKGEQ